MSAFPPEPRVRGYVARRLRNWAHRLDPNWFGRTFMAGFDRAMREHDTHGQSSD